LVSFKFKNKLLSFLFLNKRHFIGKLPYLPSLYRRIFTNTNYHYITVLNKIGLSVRPIFANC
jgi:hypothetical protein